MMTTTSTTLDPELENRLVVLGVDEDAAQTSAIIRAQRTAASLTGLRSSSERIAIRRRHTMSNDCSSRSWSSSPMVRSRFRARRRVTAETTRSFSRW